MWTRKELKTKAKQALKRNYWKTVLIALVFTIVCSGVGVFGSATGGGSQSEFTYTENATSISGELTGPGADELIEHLEGIDNTDIDNPPIEEVSHTFELSHGGEDGDHIVGEVFGHQVDVPLAGFFVVTGVLFVLAAVVLAVALAISAFLSNPVEVGTARFFTRNLNQPAQIGEVTFGFDHNYLQTVKTLFWRDVRILLWGLLLIIPGVVKSYEYRMMPYLLADDPTMPTDEAFAQSKRMMDGNKWRAFVLDLSFIGWYLLAIPTLGLITILYANPYKKMTDAALYEALRYGQAAPLDNEMPLAPAPVVTTDMSVPVHPFAALDAPAPIWEDTTAEDVTTEYAMPQSAPTEAATPEDTPAEVTAPEDAPTDAGPASPVVPDDPQA